MYIRKKKNKSGKISIQVIDKSTGTYKLVKTIGSSSNKQEIESLFKQGKDWIKDRLGQTEIDFLDEQWNYRKFIKSIKQIDVIGTDLLLGKIFDEIGFNQIQEPLFRHLVFSRICFPVSKLKTTDYLYKYHSIEIDIARTIYSIKRQTPLNKDTIFETLILNKEHQLLCDLFEL